MSRDFNWDKAVARARKEALEGTLHQHWDKIEPWKMAHFMGLAKAIRKSNDGLPEADKRFPQFLFDMQFRCRGRHSRINHNVKSVKSISEVIEVGKDHITVGLEMKSTFNNPLDYDARAKGIAFGMMTAFNNMLNDHQIVTEVLKRAGELGLPVTLHRKDFSEGPERNPQGVIGFEIGLGNMVMVNYENIYSFAMFVWAQVHKALALDSAA